MTIEEFKSALKLAMEREVEFSKTNIDIFSGFGLREFKPVHCTLADVADLIRYQAFRFDGELNTDALNKIAHAGRHKFVIVG